MPRFPLKKRVFLCFPALSRVIPHFSNILSLYTAVLFKTNIQSPSQPLCEGLRYLGLRIFAEFMDLFVSTLEQAAEMYENASDFLPMLGTVYVKFFYHNPVYFDFLFPEHEHVPIYKFN